MSVFLSLSLYFDQQKVRQEYMDVEAEYLDRKNCYDKVAVGLEMDKQALEKECDTFQVHINNISIFMYLLFLLSWTRSCLLSINGI